MPDSAISQLPLALSLSAGDYFPVDQAGVTKKATLSMLGNGTVLVAPGKVLTVNSTITFTGTDGTTITFPATSATMARTDAAQSFTGLQTFSSGLASTTGNYSGQITSTVVTGTAPFVVASTTPVANLSIGGNAATSSSTTGNAATATALQNIRTIDGINFDGTANITVVAPATNAAPSKTTPIGADAFPIYDSVSGLLNKVTFDNGIKGTYRQSITMVANAASLTLSSLYNNYVDVSGTLTAAGQITTTFPTNATQVIFDNSTTGGFALQINAGTYTIPLGKSTWIWDGSVFALVSEIITSTLPPAFRNRIINSDMSVSQLNGTTAVTPTASAFVVDQWQAIVTQASKLTFQQVADAPAGLKYSTKISVAAQFSPGAADEFSFVQALEGQNIIDFQMGTAGAVTIVTSQWIKGSVAGTYSVAILNAANNRSYIGTVNVTTAWQRLSIVLVGDTTGTWTTDNTSGCRLLFDLGSGSNFNSTAGSWQAGALLRTSGSVTFVNQTVGSTLNITGVQVEAVPTGATSPTAFEFLPYDVQLHRSQRYARPLTGGTIFGMCISTTLADMVDYGVVMRASPTISNTTGWTAVNNSGSGQAITAFGAPVLAGNGAVSFRITVAANFTLGFSTYANSVPAGAFLLAQL